MLDKPASQTSVRATGPLSGYRIVEFAGIGPGPFASMMLADMGAEVVTLDRVGAKRNMNSVAGRGRRVVEIDLKAQTAVAQVLDLLEGADALIEGFRPGVMERLGLGPDVVLARNPRLVYGRMTGWGQRGPLAERAGHDIDYIAVAGVLNAIGRAGDAPLPPLNLVGDFGGGGLLLAFGIACGVIEARTSGRGQVVDAAMVDGAALLAAMFSGFMASGIWRDERGTNILDSGAPWYDTYETREGRHVAVGAIEAKFYAELLARLDLDAALAKTQHDRTTWPALRETLAARFRERTRDEWAAVFADADACVAPVLTFAESRAHPQIVARGGAIE